MSAANSRARPYGDESHGPFDTRAAAIADARTTLSADDPSNPDAHGGEITIGRVETLDPSGYVKLDVDLAADNAADAAADDDWGWPGEGDITIRGGADSRHKAQATLDAMLRVWAREWLVSETWRMATDGTEDVTL